MKTNLRKLVFGLLTIAAVFQAPAFAADEWAKAKVAGSDNVSDIDLYIQTNNNALDRVLQNYRNGAYGYGNGNANQFVVSKGEVICSNAAGTLRKMRANPTSTTVTWLNMDTGAGDSSSTVYYYYAVGDADADTFTITISTNSSTPTGATYYKKLGAFYNNSSGDIEIGGIIEMYSGYLDALPPGYVLCDGTNGTPDLSDRFVIGTKTGSTVGAVNTSGGSLTGTGASLKTATASGEGAFQPGGTSGDSASRESHAHVYPKYYALAFIMRQGVE